MGDRFVIRERRECLLDQFRELIERCELERFVAGPLLKPTPRFFPDPWEPSLRGLRGITLKSGQSHPEAIAVQFPQGTEHDD